MNKEKVLFSNKYIQTAVKSRASEISEYYLRNKPELPITFLGNLNGCIPFYWDLLKNLDTDLPFNMDFVQTQRDGEHPSLDTYKIQLTKLPKEENIRGRQVVIVDDILDSGSSLGFLIRYLRSMNPLDIKVCVLVDRRYSQGKERFVEADWFGFALHEKWFLHGYGMDSITGDNSKRFLTSIRYVENIDEIV